MRIYGIYLLFPPTIDMRKEGLGRYIAYFIQASQKRKDIKFVIACPSWMKPSLIKLFNDFDINIESCEIITPEKQPLILTGYFMVKKLYKYKRRKKIPKLRFQSLKKINLIIKEKISNSRSYVLMGIFSIFYLIALFIKSMVRAIKIVNKFVELIIKRLFNKYNIILKSILPFSLSKVIDKPKKIQEIQNLYKLMQKGEALLIEKLIVKRKDIAAWYCPTAFWPEFNKLPCPKLLSVPDVVLSEFPVGFAKLGGDGFFEVLKNVEKTINEGDYFVTYSDHIKWNTLVDRYNVFPGNVHVVMHGVNALDGVIKLSCSDNSKEHDNLTEVLFQTALKNCTYKPCIQRYCESAKDLRFIFYASQFRPNKNLINLLKAYNFLLKQKFIKQKLILTGIPDNYPKLKEFVINNNLQNDVLCLRNISVKELAACYYRADLVVNPTLSEGGFPFTFSESLSVDTPVIMSKIPVTQEVISEFELQELMLFDPYNWEEIAEKIEWGLDNRETLFNRQKILYNKLNERTWDHVLNEYIEILDNISGRSVNSQCRLEESVLI